MKAWDSKGYWLKAKYFMDKANTIGPNDKEFPFWSALALECLARAALTKVHPALNADPRQDTNLLSAFGFEVSAQPKSIPAHSVFLRLEKIIKPFGKTQRELCDFVSLLRNQHVHSAEMPYENLNPTKWLPRFYEVSLILCEFLDKGLKDFLGSEIEKQAINHIKALREEIIKSVKQRIADFKKTFDANSKAQQENLRLESSAAVKHLFIGTVKRECPACGNLGILSGEMTQESEPIYQDEELVTEQRYSATEFECLSCGMKLKSLDEIVASEIDPYFTQFDSTSLHDLYQPDHFIEYDNM